MPHRVTKSISPDMRSAGKHDDGAGSGASAKGAERPSKTTPKHETAEILTQVIDFLRAIREKHQDVEPVQSVLTQLVSQQTPDLSTLQSLWADSKASASSLALQISKPRGGGDTAGSSSRWFSDPSKSESGLSALEKNMMQARELGKAREARRATLGDGQLSEDFIQTLLNTQNTPPAFDERNVGQREGGLSNRSHGHMSSSMSQETNGLTMPESSMTLSEYLQHPLGLAWLQKLQSMDASKAGQGRPTSASRPHEEGTTCNAPLSTVSASSEESSTSMPRSILDDDRPTAPEMSDFVLPFMAVPHSNDSVEGILSLHDTVSSLPAFSEASAMPSGMVTANSTKYESPFTQMSPPQRSRPSTARAVPAQGRTRSFTVPQQQALTLPSPHLGQTASAPPDVGTSLGAVDALSCSASSPPPLSSGNKPASVPDQETPKAPPRSAAPTSSIKKRAADTVPTRNTTTKASRASKGSPEVKKVVDRRKRRRESHNAVERRRRDLINERIAEMAALLPEPLLLEAIASSTGGGTAPHIDMSILARQCTCPQPRFSDPIVQGSPSADGSLAPAQGCLGTCRRNDEAVMELAQSKPNKGIVLTKSVEYIKHLHEICGTLRQSNAELQIQLDSIRQTLMGSRDA